MSTTRFSALAGFLLLQGVSGFYLPGVAPRKYVHGEQLMVKVNTLTSDLTPLQFDYYNIPFCEPKGGEHQLPENIGEVLAGERTETSAYQFHTNVSRLCKVACRKTWTPQNVDEYRDFAGARFRANMRLDNLPAAELVVFRDQYGKEFVSYKLGYPIAEVSGYNSSKFYINNHLRFTIRYHNVKPTGTHMDKIDEPGVLIVGFEVKAKSIEHRYEGKWDEKCAAKNTCELFTCDPSRGPDPNAPKLQLRTHKKQEVVFTYDVLWVHSDVKWASRWDVYLQMQWQDDEIHWFSIVNSSVILLFLSGMVALIMLRILRKDLYRYNQLEQSEEAREEAREETGWKLVYNDVFRPPSHATLLSVCAGTGVQLLIMSVLTLLFAALGFLSPANRGSLLSAVLFFYVLMGVPAGYVSARFCKFVKEPNHFKATLMTALLFPGVCFLVFFLVNLVAWFKLSSTAVPFGTLIVLMLLWFGISLPLIFFGAYLGFRKEPFSVPCAVSAIPRQIPPQMWYMSPWVSAMAGGLLPFGAVFVEVFYVLSSIWLHQFYYLFGFLLLVLGILFLTCCEVTVVLCYLQLCCEDYHWWWRSFLTSGSCSFYVFLYSIYYAYSKLQMARALAAFLYVCYMFIVGFAFFLITGALGFLASFVFIRTIYSAIKID
uniref:Transmembrane 9 superfamily member n=1 Tax=Hanusia phi TaxID=3032 RepID=A0A7S0EL14_9CRYP|mmetsp:Transcript_26634/g.60787  ORF Transcript_26634/g.60787 Transcript_26634/m.60787 type:complete len:656 (+) Transcript_26634:88-2055(+)